MDKIMTDTDRQAFREWLGKYGTQEVCINRPKFCVNEIPTFSTYFKRRLSHSKNRRFHEFTLFS